MSTVTPSSSAPSLDSFVDALITRAGKGDRAARTMLCNPASQHLAFCELLQTLARSTKTTLAAIVATLSPEDCEVLKRSLPKDTPQRDAFLAALKSAAINAPPTTSITLAGEKTYKDGTRNEHTMLSVTVKGEARFAETHAAKWWRAFLSVIDHDATTEAVRKFVRDAQ